MIRGTTTLVNSQTFLSTVSPNCLFHIYFMLGWVALGQQVNRSSKLAQIENNIIFFNSKPFQFSDKVKST